jgi:curved DNA-binding protein CbpA
MTNYYVSLELERNAKTEDIHDQLVALRKKWSQRANMATNPEAQSEAALKVAMIREAILVFDNEDSRRQYDFELNNQVPEHIEEAVEDEIYKKNLASANDFFAGQTKQGYEDALYITQRMLLNDDYKKAEAYEIAMLCLGNLDRQKEAKALGLEAINENGIEDRRVYRAFAIACEATDQNDIAHKYLLQLKENVPNDVNVDYTIADLFMNRFNGEFIKEAREFIDVLLEYTNIEMSPEVAEWDVRCELVQDHLPLAIAKTASYLGGGSASKQNSLTVKSENNTEFNNKFLSILTNLVELYVSKSFSKVQNYIRSVDAIAMPDNQICARKIMVWDIAFTLERSANLTEDWYKMADKIKSAFVSPCSYTVVKYYAMRCVRLLPTYSHSLKCDIIVPSSQNDKDYITMMALLNWMADVAEKTPPLQNGISPHLDVIAIMGQVDDVHGNSQCEKKIRNLRKIRLFTTIFWVIFFIPTIGIRLIESIFPASYDWQATILFEYFFCVCAVTLGSLIRRKNSLSEFGKNLVLLLFGANIFSFMAAGLSQNLFGIKEKIVSVYEKINSTFAFLGNIVDTIGEIIAKEPIAYIVIVLAVLIFSCIIWGKIGSTKKKAAAFGGRINDDTRSKIKLMLKTENPFGNDMFIKADAPPPGPLTPEASAYLHDLVNDLHKSVQQDEMKKLNEVKWEMSKKATDD